MEKDPTRFYTISEFETGIQTLWQFLTLRIESVEGQLAGIIPATAEGQSAAGIALIATGDLVLSDMGAMNMGGFGGNMGGNMGGNQGNADDGGSSGGENQDTTTPDDTADPTTPTGGTGDASSAGGNADATIPTGGADDSSSAGGTDLPEETVPGNAAPVSDVTNQTGVLMPQSKRCRISPVPAAVPMLELMLPYQVNFKMVVLQA